ncbi:YwqG family protein [Salipiger sp. P9]|uniref:YwqG family protein n=1 Tax=Salipiger pentaromativorans TaxID=2943193 RepID=UPI002157B9D7|nr:YwqG family protein [Salipiger pentaromativorans]MCR8550291.1 YwqG family protein [Salipiger pentaromativorans]
MAQISLISPTGRTADSEWPAVRSWYGGLPRLGAGVAWPRGDDGKPLHFLAQLDLSMVAQAARLPGSPQEGHLAFFADTRFDQPDRTKTHADFGEIHWPCAVLYFPQASQDDTPLPADADPVFGTNWQYHYPGGNPQTPPSTFDRIAVAFSALDATSETLRDQVHRHWAAGPTYSPYRPDFDVPADPAEILWRTVEIICREVLAGVASQERLLKTVYAKKENTPAKEKALRDKRPLIETKIGAWLDRVDRSDLNTAIGPQNGAALMDDLDEIKAVLDELKIRSGFVGSHNDRPGKGGHMDVAYYWYHGRATQRAYESMITGSDADFAALPDTVRAGLWRDLARLKYPPKGHDMFCGVDADGNINPVSEALREDATLLLELNSSFLWMWGDMGKLQFWIRKSDLAEGAWETCFLLLRSS